MRRRVFSVAFAVVIVLLGWWNFRRLMSPDAPPPAKPMTAGTAARAESLPVNDPRLHLDRLKAIQKVEYRGSKRNIFDYYSPPPPVPAELPPQAQGPPPLQVPLRFYGVLEEGGVRRALLTDGEDVYIAGSGDLLLQRFRVVRIGANVIEFEDVNDGRRAVIPLDEGGPGVSQP